LGEFSLSGLTSNFDAKKLEIGIRMDIDANGILRVDAEEARSGAKASFTVGNDKQSSRIC
jgi:molecular chaperone DnaK (HSP70)